MLNVKWKRQIYDMADNSSVYVVYTACVMLILWVGSVVKGQPVFLTPEVARYLEDATLTCEIAFNPSTGRSWKKNGVSLTAGTVDVSGTNRYSERSNSSSFSLVISAAVSSDEADYKCDYNFLASDTKKLLFDRRPTAEGMSITRNSNNKMEIGISNVYPNATVDLVTVQAEGGTVETLAGTLAETGSGDYYNYTWTSVDVIDSGKFECQITVTTRSTTVIVLDVTFGTATTTTTATTFSSLTTIRAASSATATTTSSLPTTLTSISTSTTEMRTSFYTARRTVTASPTAISTKSTVKATSTSRGTVTRAVPMTVSPVTYKDSDKALVTMIIVVSIIGGVLIVAIFFIIIVMMHWKSCFTRRCHPKQYAQRSDHRKQHRQAEYNASGRFFTTQQDHALRGYYFYNGTYKNPQFCDPFENSSYVNTYYPTQNNSHGPKYMSSHETYQYN